MNATANNPKRALALDKLPSRLRPDQVASYLNVCPNQIATLIKSGALPAIDVSYPGSRRKIFRIERAALAAFEQSRKSE